MFPSALNEVGKQFLLVTERDSISGINYTALSLLMAQAMEDMLSGYSGSSTTDKRYLSEAIGFQLANPSSDLFLINRYNSLVATIHELQKSDVQFRAIVDNFIFK